MKHVSQAVSKTFTRETERLLDSTRALKVWVQLAEIFGKAHYRENGDSPSKLWVQAIERLSDVQLATGLANLGNDGLTFPANLSQFLEACKRSKPVRHLGVPLLPPSDEERAREADRAWEAMERLAGRSLRPE